MRPDPEPVNVRLDHPNAIARNDDMKNPLDSISGTITSGVILTIVIWFVLDGLIF